jgi:hypothetical protein
MLNWCFNNLGDSMLWRERIFLHNFHQICIRECFASTIYKRDRWNRYKEYWGLDKITLLLNLNLWVCHSPFQHRRDRYQLDYQQIINYNYYSKNIYLMSMKWLIKDHFNLLMLEKVVLIQWNYPFEKLIQVLHSTK